MRVTAASGGSLLLDQYRPFAIIKTEKPKRTATPTTAAPALDHWPPLSPLPPQALSWFACTMSEERSWPRTRASAQRATCHQPD
jgi:hypothetical protein